jgi:nucleotide-binding universal stress UspA family protein
MKSTEKEAQVKTILVATDGSACGQQAEDAGVELAAAARARVIFLNVRHEGDSAHRPPGETGSHPNDSQALLDRALVKAVEAGVAAECETVEGNPAHEIIEAARTNDADVIVVGSRGLGKISSVLLGSVSQAVLREADRPVLIVKEKS